MGVHSEELKTQLPEFLDLTSSMKEVKLRQFRMWWYERLEQHMKLWSRKRQY